MRMRFHWSTSSAGEALRGAKADEVVDALVAYREAGVTQFLCMGHPDLEEMTRFRELVLPRVRAREQTTAARPLAVQP